MSTYEQVMEIVRGYVASEHDGNVRAAAAALKLKDASILAQWLDERKKPRLESIAPVLDVIGARFLPPAEELKDYGIIRKSSAKAGAGSSLETDDSTDGFYAFRKDWLSKLGIKTENAVLLDVVGDSMEPLLRAGDTLLVDKSETRLMDGGIYVVTMCDELLVKRVYKGLDCITLHSENPRYKDNPVSSEMMDKLRIHGRVRWVGKEL